MLLVLALGLADVVLKRLLFDLHLDVLFLLCRQLLVWHVHGLSLLLQVAGVLQGGCPLKVGLQGPIHIW